jgi:hypothetical protein
MMDTQLTMKPSDYVRRQVWMTFMDDPVGAQSLEVLGAGAFMGLDFPHTDSTWPHSLSVIDKNFSGVPTGSPTRCSNNVRAVPHRHLTPAPAPVAKTLGVSRRSPRCRASAWERWWWACRSRRPATTDFENPARSPR